MDLKIKNAGKIALIPTHVAVAGIGKLDGWTEKGWT